MSGKTCHICGKMGHLSSQCSQRTCRICGGKGHLASTCPKNPANAVRKCRKCGKAGHYESECYLYTSQKAVSICSKCGGPHELYACTIMNFAANNAERSCPTATRHIFISNLSHRMSKSNCYKLAGKFGEVLSLEWIQYPEQEPAFSNGEPPLASAPSGSSEEGKETAALATTGAVAAEKGDKPTTANEVECPKLVGCFLTYESAAESDRAVDQIHDKKVLGRRAKAWHMTTVDTYVKEMAVMGRLTAVERYCMASKKETEEMMREHEINSIQGRLAAMEKNMRNNSTLDDGARSKNKHMFGADKEGVNGVWNGMGVTKTVQCPTLITTNVPRSVPLEDVKAIFSKCAGFFALRHVRGMYFIDYDSIANATHAMIVNQNYMFEGHAMVQGLTIDYDKDTRSKRNKQYELSLKRPY